MPLSVVIYLVKAGLVSVLLVLNLACSRVVLSVCVVARAADDPIAIGVSLLLLLRFHCNCQVRCRLLSICFYHWLLNNALTDDVVTPALLGLLWPVFGKKPSSKSVAKAAPKAVQEVKPMTSAQEKQFEQYLQFCRDNGREPSRESKGSTEHEVKLANAYNYLRYKAKCIGPTQLRRIKEACEAGQAALRASTVAGGASSSSAPAESGSTSGNTDGSAQPSSHEVLLQLWAFLEEHDGVFPTKTSGNLLRRQMQRKLEPLHHEFKHFVNLYWQATAQYMDQRRLQILCFIRTPVSTHSSRPYDPNSSGNVFTGLLHCWKAYT